MVMVIYLTSLTGTYWVNSLNTSTSPSIASTTSVHYFRQRNTLAGPVTIPAGTTPGEKLMRVFTCSVRQTIF
jgi:hypothetical protein